MSAATDRVRTAGIVPAQRTPAASRAPTTKASPTSTASTAAACAPPTHAGGAAARDPAAAAAIPLGQLLRQAARAVAVGLPDAVWVVAAVAAVKPARGGHSIELVEAEVARGEAGLLRAYLPESVIEALRRSTGQAVAASDLAGMTVVVRVGVELHPRWGLSGRIYALGPGIETSLAKLALAAAIDRLRREGLLDRQRRLPAPRDVTRVAVVHPAAAAGWADIAGELARWEAIGLLSVRSVPVAFEGSEAAAGIASALGRATAAVDGHAPDVVLLVRGGGAAASLGSLDSEALARTIAKAPVPVIAGLGHAIDRTLADHVAWKSVDTPSKSLALVRDLMVGPARRAQADHAAVLAAVSAGVERAMPSLVTLERRLTAEALRRVVAAIERLQLGWSAVREATEGARGRLARLDDTLDRLAADIVQASPLLVGRTAAELAALADAIRARARRAAEGADQGARQLATASARAVALVDAADADLVMLGRTASAVVTTQIDRADADLDVLAGTIRERSRGYVTGADDGSRAFAVVETGIRDTHLAQDTAIARLREAIEIAVSRRLEAAAVALDRALDALDGADPANVLRLGYALVTDGQRRPVISAAAARAASCLLLTFADGSVVVRRTDLQPDNGDQP